MRRAIAFIGAGLFFFLIVSMYLVLDQFSKNTDRYDLFIKTKLAHDSVLKLEKDVEVLEQNIVNSQNVVNNMRQTISKLPGKDDHKEQDEDERIRFHPKQVKPLKKSLQLIGKNDKQMCLFSEEPSGVSADVKMLDVFKIIPFDNPDGGAWKQGWDVQYPANAFDKEKLLVFVVPHSHNDPGWLKTVDQYYRDQTSHILDNVVDALSEDQRRKFIWAEISYLSMWWSEADERRKNLAQNFMRNGQLEIVTGGWVMTDEANPHYYAIIDQMIEGHQWLERYTGIKPKSGWAIDPFGHSPTQAYILKRMGFDAMLIQRTHYSVKKYLAKERKLEFMWRQNWDHGSSTDIFCHMMPFYSYDVPHTCGPDPKICCQFDFRRLPGGGHSCPWFIPPEEIGDHNVAQRAEMLLDQYKKKAQLYQANVVLAPLGDDFRYEISFETQKQYTNYQKLMDYINSHPEMKAEVKFGTLSDYFRAIWQRRGVKPGEKPPGFPVLGGDFFTYADRDDHYWSGYFTSRSFYKNMDRVLEAHHRAAEIIYSLASAYARSSGTGGFPSKELFPKLVQTRQDLGLFQHHDGITGTGRDHVVIDYGERLLRSIRNCEEVMETSSHFLLYKDKKNYYEASDHKVIKFGEGRLSHDSLPLKELIIISSSPKTIVVYNSLAQERIQIISLHVSEPLVEVQDSDGNLIPSQTSLIWDREQKASSKKYELSFLATVSPLGLSTYQILRSKKGTPAKVEILNSHQLPKTNGAFKVQKSPSEDILVKNKFMKAVFDPAVGLLREITTVADDKTTKMNIQFLTYGTTGGMDKSGAYLFLPDGEAQEIGTSSPEVVVTRGHLFTEVRSQLQFATHAARMYHVDVPEARAIDIKNLVDIRNSYNKELVMRIETGIKNVDREFFTDLNGFQIQKRRTLDKLPLQANFYPLPAMAFLEDDQARVTLVSAQSNGAASLKQGWLEVVLDRRMFQDDNRGLGQGVTDNKVTPANFLLFLGKPSVPKKQVKSSIPTAYPSTLGISLSHRLQHPLYSLSSTSSLDKSAFLTSFKGITSPLSCDLFLLNLRTIQKFVQPIPDDKAALLLHRIGYDCNFEYICPGGVSNPRVNEIFNPLQVKHFEETSLTLMHSKGNVKADSRLSVDPMEIRTFKLSLS